MRTNISAAFFLLLLAASAATGCGAETGLTSGERTDVDAAVATDAANHADAKTNVDATTDVDASTSPVPTPAQGQRILFELSRVNYAWGQSVAGFYVTDEGKVYQYEYFGPTPWDGAEPYVELVPGMTEAQVTGKFGSNAQLVGTVDHATLLAQFGKLGAARSGLLLSEMGCADYGEDRYVGYLYDTATSLYTPVPLGTDGDLAAKNTAPEGDVLIEWIRSISGLTGERACQFATTTCGGTLCSTAPPCTSGTVPMYPSNQGCMTTCGGPSRCDHVDSCAVCIAASSACIVDANGVSHCLDYVQGCQQGVACDCGGIDLCAGGTAFCHGAASTGISCSAP
jgi:hypothetical protein